MPGTGPETGIGSFDRHGLISDRVARGDGIALAHQFRGLGAHHADHGRMERRAFGLRCARGLVKIHAVPFLDAPH